MKIESLEWERGFRLIGDIDFPDAPVLRKAREPELHGTVVLDLAAVHFMVDDGLGILVWAMKSLRAAGGSLIIRNPSAEVRRLLDLTGLAKVLTIEAPGEGG